MPRALPVCRVDSQIDLASAAPQQGFRKHLRYSLSRMKLIIPRCKKNPSPPLCCSGSLGTQLAPPHCPHAHAHQVPLCSSLPNSSYCPVPMGPRLNPSCSLLHSWCSQSDPSLQPRELVIKIRVAPSPTEMHSGSCMPWVWVQQAHSHPVPVHLLLPSGPPFPRPSWSYGISQTFFPYKGTHNCSREALPLQTPSQHPALQTLCRLSGSHVQEQAPGCPGQPEL